MRAPRRHHRVAEPQPGDPVALAEAVDDHKVAERADERRERPWRRLACERAEALVDDDLTDASLDTLDEGDELVVRRQAAVRVVGVDDHDRVDVVAVDPLLEPAEVEPEVLARI